MGIQMVHPGPAKGFPLLKGVGIQAVELLVQPIFGGFTGVDGAPTRGHLPDPVRPKNRGPFQCAPVMALAIALSDGQVLPP